ncbi:MAG: cytochrome c biogenesis protein ResB [Deltaproteobacteria bacterium]|nr:cytochrome c biogenesis protein ResB [Deltaproteobacteria bacterium]
MPIAPLTKRIVSFFLSRKVAITLLVLMTALLVLSSQLPDINMMDEEMRLFYQKERSFSYNFSKTFGGTGIISSPWFYVLPAFIFLSTLICTIERLIRRKKKDPGFWGSMIFHAGLLTIIVAAMITKITLFEGEVLLTEGYSFPLGREGYLRILREPESGIELPEGSITMTRYANIYQGEFAIDHEASVTIDRGDIPFETVIKVNHPLKIDGLQYTLHKYGFAPAFVVKGDKGEVLVDAFINLVVVKGKEDSFEVPGKNTMIYVRFHPDFEMTDKGPRSKSRLPNNPVVAVKVKRWGKESKFQHIKMGSSANIMGYHISFPELKYWAHFLVKRDQGIPVFIVAFFLVVGGLSMRFLTMKRNVKGEAGKA